MDRFGDECLRGLVAYEARNWWQDTSTMRLDVLNYIGCVLTANFDEIGGQHRKLRHMFSQTLGAVMMSQYCFITCEYIHHEMRRLLGITVAEVDQEGIRTLGLLNELLLHKLEVDEVKGHPQN